MNYFSGCGVLLMTIDIITFIITVISYKKNNYPHNTCYSSLPVVTNSINKYSKYANTFFLVF